MNSSPRSARAILSSYAEATGSRRGRSRARRRGEDSRSCYRLRHRADRACSQHRDRFRRCSLCRLCWLVSRPPAGPHLLPPEFIAGFDQLRAENGLGKIRKRKGSYAGIRLVCSHETQATADVAATRLVAACRRRSRHVRPGRGRSRRHATATRYNEKGEGKPRSRSPA